MTSRTKLLTVPGQLGVLENLTGHGDCPAGFFGRIAVARVPPFGELAELRQRGPVNAPGVLPQDSLPPFRDLGQASGGTAHETRLAHVGLRPCQPVIRAKKTTSAALSFQKKISREAVVNHYNLRRGPMEKHLSPTSALALWLAAPLAITAIAPFHASANGVSAGTLIENTAVATYDDGGASRTINSNTVTVRVDELIDVTLTSLDSGPLTATPGDAVLSFELTNQSNGPEAFRLIANPTVAGNNFEVMINGIAIDSNGNGVYDPGVDEILTGPETTAIMAAGDALTVFVLVTVPDTASDGDFSDVELSAQAVTGFGAPGTVFAGSGVDGGDAIIGMTGAFATASGRLIAGIASVELVKAVSLRDPFGGTGAVPGTIATFTITATVSGTGSIDNLVVTDAIPAGTTYVPGTLTLDGTGLTDATDGDAGEASNADGIRVDLQTVNGGNSHAITFDVEID